MIKITGATFINCDQAMTVNGVDVEKLIALASIVQELVESPSIEWCSSAIEFNRNDGSEWLERI